MICKNTKGAIFFLIGAIGYTMGFLAWLFWLLLVIANLVIDWHGHPSIMSGILFQSRRYLLIDYSLFSASFALGNFGSLGLKIKHNSNMALACGIIHMIVAAILVYSLSRWYLLSNYAVIALFVGMLMWGATLLKLREPFQPAREPFQPTIVGAYWSLNKFAGTLFIVAALIGILIQPVILYWGIESWFMFAGWLYAAGAVATAILLFRISEA